MLFYFIKKAQKILRVGYISNSGRNYLGTICVHHKGGGLKKNYIMLIFFVD